MKKIYYILGVLLIALCAFFLLHGNGGTKDNAHDSINIVGVDSLPRIVEAEGVVGDGTSMNELELIAANGDTVYISAPEDMIMGGARAGETVNVVYYVNNDENLASLAINLTSLQHLWTEKSDDGNEMSIELDPKGVAVSYNMSKEYVRWTIENGLLLLHTQKPIIAERQEQEADTFHIMDLSDQRLVLMHQNHEMVFELAN